MIFVETSVFTRQVKALLSDDDYAAFQRELVLNPTIGDVIEGAGGLRKTRVAASGRGKRGGARVIYYYLDRSAQIRLLLIYAKASRDNLSAAEKAVLRKLNEDWQ